MNMTTKSTHPRSLAVCCLVAACCLAAVACSKDKNVSRSETVRFYSADSPDKSITYLQLPLEGVTDGTIYIESNTPVSVATQLTAAEMMSAESSWITVDVTKESDCSYRVRYCAEPLKGNLNRRSACINATSTQMYLGSYLKLCQGYELFWICKTSEVALSSSNASWSTGVIDNIASTSWDYIAFNAYAENPDAVSTKDVYPLRLALPEETYFESNSRTDYVVDVPLGNAYTDGNLIYLPFRSVNGGFSSETEISFTSLSDADSSVKLHIGNIKIYKVSDQLREVLEGGDSVDGGGDAGE